MRTAAEVFTQVWGRAGTVRYSISPLCARKSDSTWSSPTDNSVRSHCLRTNLCQLGAYKRRCWHIRQNRASTWQSQMMEVINVRSSLCCCEDTAIVAGDLAPPARGMQDLSRGGEEGAYCIMTRVYCTHHTSFARGGQGVRARNRGATDDMMTVQRKGDMVQNSIAVPPCGTTKTLEEPVI